MTVTTIEPKPKRKQYKLTREQRVRRALYATPGHPNTEVVIPSCYLGPALDEAIERTNAELAEDYGTAWRDDGAVTICAERAAMSLSTPDKTVTAEAMLRRLYSVRKAAKQTSEERKELRRAGKQPESEATTARYADAFLLGLDVMLGNDVDLPHLPAGFPAAMEMADAYFEFHPDEEPDPETRREFAYKLWRFSTAFLNADRVLDTLAEVKEETWEEALKEYAKREERVAA